MIFPFLRTTIYGAVWYQGESNAGMNNYWCTFPAMVDDWRDKWYLYTNKQTDPVFPFGFVHLSTWNAGEPPVAELRWQQTAKFGFVPNTRQVNYFMSEAMDLGSTPPEHDIHPPNKQDVGLRLALGARAIAYGEAGVYWTGPLISSATMTSAGEPNAVVNVRCVFDHLGAGGFEVRNPDGFELQDKTSGAWVLAKASKSAANTVTVSANLASGHASNVRYAWRSVPCEEKLCALYSVPEAIPTPPFIKAVA